MITHRFQSTPPQIGHAERSTLSPPALLLAAAVGRVTGTPFLASIKPEASVEAVDPAAQVTLALGLPALIDFA